MEMTADNGLGQLMSLRSCPELNQQALSEVSRPHPRRIQRLHPPQSGLQRLRGGGRKRGQLGKTAPKIAVVVKISNDERAQPQELRISDRQMELEKEVVLKRAGSREQTLAIEPLDLLASDRRAIIRGVLEIALPIDVWGGPLSVALGGRLLGNGVRVRGILRLLDPLRDLLQDRVLL